MKFPRHYLWDKLEGDDLAHRAAHRAWERCTWLTLAFSGILLLALALAYAYRVQVP